MAITARWPTMVMGARFEPCTTMGTNSKACIRRGKTKGEESLGEEGRSGTKEVGWWRGARLYYVHINENDLFNEIIYL